MDDRANQPATNELPGSSASVNLDTVSQDDALPELAGPQDEAPRNQNLIPAGSSVRRHTVERAGGSSRTRAFSGAAASSASAEEVRGGSTARRAQIPVGRLEDQPTVISKQPPTGLTPATTYLQPAEMGRVLQGEMLGHFELLEFVGGGGMGAVFRALDTMLNRTVAVKVLSHEQSDDEETLRRFKNEAQSAARLDHENIGRVHYVGEDGGWHYIVFEFIEGINLRDLVERDGPLPVADAVSFMLQLGDALAHAAKRDVVHRDIKPSNVLITPEGRAKLVDMGLARLHQVEHANNDLTASGVTLGTFDYISPEQARDPRSADVRSDLYSLGCTFYFMLAGRPPFADGTVLQKLLQHQGDEPPDVRTYCPHLPDDLYRILRRLLAKLPGDRYQDPAELVTDLSSAAVRLGLRPSSPGSAVWLAAAAPERPQWQRTVPWLAPVAALVLIVAVLNIVWAPYESTAPPLLGRLPKPAGPPPVQATVLPEPSVATQTGRTDQKLPKIGETATPKRADADTAVDSSEDAASAPRVERDDAASPGESLLSGVFQIWNAIRSEEFSTRLTDAHKHLRLPFRFGHSLMNAPPAPSEAALSPAPALVVAGKESREGEYSSLAAAMRQAKNGDIIELRFDGVLEEHPLEIPNLRLTVRAAQKRSPVIRFVVDEEDLLAERRGMITVEGGQLDLHNVQLSFTVPRDATGEWSLFELGHADELRFQGCVVTLRNQTSGRAGATMIHARAGLADGSGMMQDSMPVAEPVRIVAEQSIFRGDATFLKFAKFRPVDMRLEKTLVAVAGRLVKGDVTTASSRSVKDTQIELRHTTVLAESGLIALSNDTPVLSAGSSAMQVEVKSVDSILAGNPGSPMIEQVGNNQRYGGHFTWVGDRSFYDGFDPLLRVIGAGPTQEYSFQQWRNHMDIQDNQTKASDWFPNFPVPPEHPLHEITPWDFQLYDDSLAIESASKGGDAGAVLADLPTPETNAD